MKSIDKTEQLNQLFEEWENSIPEYKNKFIKDGIINEELFQNANQKILFIEKEGNNPKQEAGDFREWWKTEVFYGFSYRLAEWSYGIMNSFPAFDTIWENEKLYHKMIQQIALVNIKKSGGTGNSDFSEMMRHLQMNKEFLCREIDIINPEIIITGVTWNELLHGLFPGKEWIKSGYTILLSRCKNARVIDFYHPSARNGPAASYSLMQNVVKSDAFQNL